MELISKPIPRYPYACAATGRDDGELVDLQIEVAGDSHIYLRKSVIEEAGKLIGLAPAAEVERVAEMAAGLTERLTELEAQVDTYKSIVDGFTALGIEPVTA